MSLSPRVCVCLTTPHFSRVCAFLRAITLYERFTRARKTPTFFMLWWYARVWTRRSDGEVADVEKKEEGMESPLPPPLSPPPPAGAAAFNSSVHILLVFTFLILTFWLFTRVFEIWSRAGRTSSSSVWQMVLFRCDYRCALWGRWGAEGGYVTVINAHAIYSAAILHPQRCTCTFVQCIISQQPRGEAERIQLLVGDMLKVTQIFRNGVIKGEEKQI